MVKSLEHRAVIRFLVLRGKDTQYIINELNAAYGDDCPSRTTVYEWVKQFKGGRTSIDDDPRTGRPVEVGDDKCQELAVIVRKERRLTKQELSARLKIGVGSVQRLMKSMRFRLERLGHMKPQPTATRKEEG